MQGTVKNWFDQHGYGFVTNGPHQYFVHRTRILGQSARRHLNPGDTVEFTPAESERGLCAHDVRVLKPLRPVNVAA